jgi:hypothetical protein
MAFPQPRSGSWLIPGALAFLAAAIVFATVMLVWHGGPGTGTAAAPPVGAAGPASVGSAPAAPASAAASATTPAAGGQAPVTIRGAVTGLCVDVHSGGQGGAVVQDKCDGSDSQRWRRSAGSGGGILLVNVSSHMCLDVFGAGTDNGVKVEQWSCNGGNNQLWRLAAAPGGGVALVSVNSGKCLDVPSRSAKAGVKLQQYECNGTSAQQWIVV